MFEEKIEEIIYEFRIGRNMENPSKRLLQAICSEIEEAMPNKRGRDKKHKAIEECYGEGYDHALGDYKSALLKRFGGGK